MVSAGVGAAVAVAAFAPGAAMAHPCAGSTATEESSFLSLNSARWVGLYPTHVIGIDFTTRTLPSVFAYADPKPLPKGTNPNGSTFDPDGGDWSTYWYNGKTVTATDNAGNVTTQSVEYVVNSTAVTSTPGGAFTPGVGATYNASTTANVVSTAGDGLLSVSDASSTATGRLVNGAFSLAAPIQARASSAGGTGAALAAVGGSAAPTPLLTYTAPKSNDTVTLSFAQAVGQNEALRTGTYSKALTFTLSTTTP